jgi:hypothetical protein
MSKKDKQLSPSDSLQSAIWLIGIAILFLTGDWWPGILILGGISVLAEFLIRRSPPAAAAPASEAPAAPEPEPAPLEPTAISAEPAPPARRLDLLPDACPACGAKVRSGEVRWVDAQSAECAYCGTSLIRRS